QIAQPAPKPAQQTAAPGPATPCKPRFEWLLRPTRAFLRRPDAPRLLAIAVLVLFVLMMPGFSLFLLVLSLLVGLVLYLSFGPDRIEEMAKAWFQRLRARDPAAAEKLWRRATTVSNRITALTERLPDRWTSGIQIPAFGNTAQRPEKFDTDPFDRLAKETGQGD
ncbi:MAG: hypothetical protein AAGF79_21735, partial [Pseudomonadota bacterium]